MENKTYAIIPTMPSRYDVVFTAISSLLPQVDEVFVFGHGCDADLFNIDRVCFFGDVDKGSASRFAISRMGISGYLAFCDDDLEYAPNYIEMLKTKLEQYSRRCVVGVHGKTINAPLVSCFGKGEGRIRENYPCLADVDNDVEVHIIGTGALMYHTSMLSITETDFVSGNLDDAEFSILCQKRNIPLVVVAHKLGVVRYLNPQGWTIWDKTVENQQPLLDVINSHDWKLFGTAQDNGQGF